MRVTAFLNDLIEDVRTVYGLAEYFIMSPQMYKQMVREFQELNPAIRKVDEYRGIPVTVSPSVRFDTVFLMPFDLTATNLEDENEHQTN
ncbi:MAG: hypothetical protein ACQEUT_18050 [Bacillota bacterium]